MNPIIAVILVLVGYILIWIPVINIYAVEYLSHRKNYNKKTNYIIQVIGAILLFSGVLAGSIQ